MTLSTPSTLSTILLLAGAGLLTLAVWWGIHPPQAIRWTPATRAGKTRPTTIDRAWLELTGFPLTPKRLTHINWLFAGLIALLIFVTVHNPIVAVAFGVLASTVPEAAVRWYARKQWIALDMSAFAAINTLSFYIARQQSVLESLRQIIPESDNPFRTWAGKLLAQEAAQMPLEYALKQAADKIRHVELSLIADILAVERERGGTAPMIMRAVGLWSQRIRADGMRRGRLNATSWLARGLLGIAVVVYWMIIWQDPSAHRAIGHGIGMLVTGVSAALIMTAGLIQQRVTRQAEQV
jgi:Flp pilus assembly protein TadB